MRRLDGGDWNLQKLHTSLNMRTFDLADRSSYSSISALQSAGDDTFGHGHRDIEDVVDRKHLHMQKTVIMRHPQKDLANDKPDAANGRK